MESGIILIFKHANFLKARKTVRLHPCLVLLIAPAFVGCADNNKLAEQISASGNIITTVNFVSGTDTFDAIRLFENDGVVPDMVVRVVYPDHESEVEIGGLSADEAANEVLTTEEGLLDFLITQFNPNDRLEDHIYDDLTADLSDIRTNGTLEVHWVTMNGEFTIEDGIVDSVLYAELPNINERPTASGKSITDYTGDDDYVPAGGTSTIYTSGTLQKFWMDEDSADSFNAASDGLEMDTLISSRSYASCGSSTSSNMPDYYKDTEAFDSLSGYRTCSIGTISADELVEDELYWTWHTFSSFSSTRNPRILINFQPTRWGSAVLNETMCIALGAWCMYGRTDMPIEHLISYYYNDAPGVEEDWTKN